eukprot:3180173-Karenia_brevis.AAC.1
MIIEVSTCDHVGAILGSYKGLTSDHPGVISESSRGVSLGSARGHFEIIQGIFWDHPGVIVGSSR